MFNIFETYRKFGFNVTVECFIKFQSPDYVINNHYCEHSNINGTGATALIDGNENTAWATESTNDPEQQYFIMEFVQKPVYINTFYFHSLCSPPKKLIIEGSNDQNNNWETICEYNEPIKPDTITPIQCFKRKYYKYIKLYQTMNVDNNTRLHIHNIEIYGTFERIPVATCYQNAFFPNFLMYAIML